MFELLLKFPKALYWGLPNYLREQGDSKRAWRENADRRDCSATAVLGALEAAYALNECAKSDESREENITGLASYADVVVNSHQLVNNPWNVLIAGVEIPAVLAGISPDNKAVRKLLKGSASLLAESANVLFDEEGVVRARHFSWYAAIVATWTRCIAASRRKQINLKLKKHFIATFEWTARQLLLCSNGKRAISELADGGEIKLAKPFIALLLKLGGDLSDRRLASHMGYTQREFLNPSEHHFLPDATLHSAESQVVVMRSGWDSKRCELYIRYEQQDVYVDIVSTGVLLFSGNVASNLVVDGMPLSPLGAWEEVCWESDDDVEYLELEISCSGGWKLQKHFLLAKDENLVLVGDVVLGDGRRGSIQLQQAYQYGEGISFYPSEEHAEGFLWSKDPVGMVLPLALPEWRAGTRCGSLTDQVGLLTYNVTSEEATGLYAPLLMVLSGKTVTKDYTWRQLTVAEELNIQPKDVAAGYRIQIGEKNWLLYRSMTEFGNRTLLGQNYSSEFAFGEFLEDGTVYEYVEIE